MKDRPSARAVFPLVFPLQHVDFQMSRCISLTANEEISHWSRVTPAVNDHAEVKLSAQTAWKYVFRRVYIKSIGRGEVSHSSTLCGMG